MATIAPRAHGYSRSLAPDTYERVLAIGAVLILVATLAALARGHAEWHKVPWLVWPHLATIVVALALTPILLLGRRGDGRHRLLGRIWVVSLLATAILSFGLTTITPGKWSLIHLLSAWTIVQAPLVWWSAKTHNLRMHRSTVRGMVTGALLVAGFFTFPFDRLLGHWLFG